MIEQTKMAPDKKKKKKKMSAARMCIHSTSLHPIVVEMFQSGGLTDRLTKTK